MSRLNRGNIGRAPAWALGACMGLMTMGCSDDAAGGGGNGGDGGAGNGDSGNGTVGFAITRVSVNSAGEEGVGASMDPAIAADGQRVVFTSGAGLVPDDTNDVVDVFMHDRAIGATTRVSVGSDGTEADGGFEGSDTPSISGNGRFVAFVSGQHFVHDSAYSQIYLRDLQDEDTFLISVDGNMEPAGSAIYSPSVSDDGRHVAYASDWDMLQGAPHPDHQFERHIYLHDRQGNDTIRASTSSEGEIAAAPGNPPAMSRRPSISGDGRFVAFHSHAENLVEGIDNGRDDVFVHDAVTGNTSRVSVANDGSEGEGDSLSATVSNDARYVAFRSASNFAEGDTHLFAYIYVRDRQEGTTHRIGDSSVDFASDPSISADGRYLAFVVNSGNVDTVYWHDRQTGVFQRVSETPTGEQPNDDSQAPAISADGRVIAFHSDASDLVDGDTNGQRDVFVAVLQ